MKVLFVCTGNICRSPVAHTIFEQMVQQSNLSDKITVDSCATSDYHVGEQADSRMRQAAKARGYDMTHIVRQLDPVADLDGFDLILYMDDEHEAFFKRLPNYHQHADKCQRLSDYCKAIDVDCVPDPYFGSLEGFEHVIDICEDSCRQLLSSIR